MTSAISTRAAVILLTELILLDIVNICALSSGVGGRPSIVVLSLDRRFAEAPTIPPSPIATIEITSPMNIAHPQPVSNHVAKEFCLILKARAIPANIVIAPELVSTDVVALEIAFITGPLISGPSLSRFGDSMKVT